MHPQLIKETTLELDPSILAWDHLEMCAIISIFAFFFFFFLKRTTTIWVHYNIVLIFYLQHGGKSKQVYWMLPMMDDMYNQLYMLPDGQCFYVMEPAFSLILGHSDIISVSSYSLAMMKKKHETAIQQQPDEKKRTTSENTFFFLQSEVEVHNLTQRSR